MTTTQPMEFPHSGRCEGCRKARRCNFCGDAWANGATAHCTNGRCSSCHAAVCTGGGATSPGHGFGVSGRVECGGDRGARQ